MLTSLYERHTKKKAESDHQKKPRRQKHSEKIKDAKEKSQKTVFFTDGVVKIGCAVENSATADHYAEKVDNRHVSLLQVSF
jgi:3-deoxy-D-arabino-heptulosonate 7-phosphate (DAHP) synthase